MRWRKPCTAILTATFLSLGYGCSMLPPAPPTKDDPLPPNAMQPCTPVDLIPEDRPLPYGDLFQTHIELIEQYGECAARHRALIDAANVGREKREEKKP